MKYSAIAFVLTTAFSSAQAAQYNVLIDGGSAIFLAGRTDIVIPPSNQPWGTTQNTGMIRHGGPTPEEELESLPPSIPVTGGQTVKVLDPASGGINYFNGLGPPYFGPDGNPGDSSLASFGGISGYLAATQGALAGVFLSDAIPNGSPPSTLNFTNTGLGTDFLTLSPDIGQVFYIGNGQTSASIFQTFIAPAGATRLFFGIPDGFGFVGLPGAYDDNDGSYSIRVGVDEDPVVGETPIPGALPLFISGLAGLGFLAHRRRRKATAH